MTKKLSLASLICFGIYFVLQFIIIFFPNLYTGLFAPDLTAELSLYVQLSLVGQALCIFPFGAVCLWSYLKKDITLVNSIVTVILAPLLYIIKTLLSNFIYTTTIMTGVTSLDGADNLALFGIVRMVLSFVSVLQFASLVLICCAGAVELYITNSQKEGN